MSSNDILLWSSTLTNLLHFLCCWLHLDWNALIFGAQGVDGLRGRDEDNDEPSDESNGW